MVERIRHGWLPLALLFIGCATASSGRGGSGEGGHESEEEASRAEATRTVALLSAVTGGVEERGARLSFVFWAERGAVTLTSFEATGREGVDASGADAGAVRHDLETLFTRFLHRRTGEVKLILQRVNAGWTVEYDATSSAPRPPEAKSLPIQSGVSPGGIGVLTEGVSKLLKAVSVPSGGAASVDVEVQLEDRRVVGWDLLGFRVTRGGRTGQPTALPHDTVTEVTSVLLPFTEGLGQRSVQVRLHVEHRGAEAYAHGWVEKAHVVRPPPPLGMSGDFAAEYRALHEEILRQWQDEVEEGAKWAARKGVEELALWFVGGIFTRGAGILVQRATPTVFRALGRGGQAATGWLRSMVKRLPGKDKRAFEQLWAKAQLEGSQALSRVEREELRQLMVRFEQLAKSALSTKEKDAMREVARKYYKKLRPEFVDVMDKYRDRYPVHHRRPLEYAHLFPDEDINSAQNLALVQEHVHKRINALWAKFRNRSGTVTSDEVKQAAKIIDTQFKPWYHRIDVPESELKLIQQAEEEAMRELRKIFPGLK